MTGRDPHPLEGAAEIAVLSTLYGLTLWIVGPYVATNAWAVAFYWAAVAFAASLILWVSPFVLHRDPPSLRGWGRRRERDDPGRAANAWPSYLALTVVAAVALVAAAAIRDPALAAHVAWPRFWAKLVIYLVYGTIQAMVFFGWLQTRLRTTLAALVGREPLTRPLVAVAVASLFALAHAPNWPLAALSLGVGFAWSWLFYARPNVLLMGISHGVLGAILSVVVGFYTRIGPFYAHPAGWIARYAIPGLRDLTGDLF